jgi:hypothetical protein
MRLYLGLPLLLVLLFVACGPTNSEEDVGDGGAHRGDSQAGGQTDGRTGTGDGPIDQNPSDNCSAAAKLVYVVDENGHFLSFDPSTTPPTLTDLGLLNKCPISAGEQPFSMGVDRDAIAWVLSSAVGGLGTQKGTAMYRVDIKNNLACTNAGMQMNQQGFNLFGMGFVTNDVGGTTDTLFIAGGASADTATTSTLGTVSFPDLTVHPINSVSGWPELTGNSNAELWGFFPDATAPKIARIDKTTAAESPTYPLPTLQGTPAAWAFAFWGGDFWVFLRRQSETQTTVYHVVGTTGQIANQWTTSALLGGGSYSIVGAGVSTCAPVIIE